MANSKLEEQYYDFVHEWENNDEDLILVIALNERLHLFLYVPNISLDRTMRNGATSY